MRKFEPCELCRHTKHPGYTVELNRAYVGKHAATTLVECDCHKQWAIAARAQRLVDESDLPNNTDAGPHNYDGKRSLASVEFLKRYVEQWPSNDKVRQSLLYVWGPPGTQKTTMIDWVGQQVCRYGANVRYFDTRSLARILTVGDWDDKTRVQEDINKIQQADLVVIDGFFEQDIARAEGEESKDFYRRRRDTTGLVSAPDWLANHVYNILKDRVDRKLGSSIVISNTPPHMIAPKYGPQLITLIKMQCKNTTLEFQDVYDGIYALGEGGLFDD